MGRRFLPERRWKLGLVAAAATCAVVGTLAGAARSARTTFDETRTIQFNGRPTFPIVLSPGPPLGGTTPWGTSGLAETSAAGVNMYRTGIGGIWSDADIKTALAWDRAAAALHVFTWPNLGGYSQALPGSPQDAGLANVVETLTNDPSGSAIAMWKGRDEPWWSEIAPSALQFAYCRVTGRGDPSWCDGELPLDPSQLWVTIEAPQGTAANLAPYSDVTDVHGVDIYPVTLAHPQPNLQRVGNWTRSLASITPLGPVWTTLQICASGSFDKTTGNFILPTYQQERYMAYDAILNGAKALTFFGGDKSNCFSGTDSQYSWNWSFWQSVLKPLIQQISASSPIAPALVNGATAPHVTTGKGMEAVIRQGTSVDDLWLIAARNGAGTRTVTLKGLPGWARRGSVYTEDRTVTASHGMLRDRFNQWDVHVYHFVEPLLLRKTAPGRATVGSRVTLQGKGLAAVSAVSFGGAKARFRVVSDGKLVATVPQRARSGRIVLTSPLKQVESKASFVIVPRPAKQPRISGVPRVGNRLRATTGTWYGDEVTSYTFSWLACNRRGLDCKPVSGATRETLKLGTAQRGRRVRVDVTAHTRSATGSFRSAATGVVGG
jgi:hypothetical protein